MRMERKQYTAEEKVAILRRHLLDKVPVSDLCEELGPAADCVLPLAEGVL
jgi:transposase-like protein